VTVVAADPDRDRVYVVDLLTDSVRSTIMLEPGDEPGRVIEDGARRVHVALRRGGAVVTIDPMTGMVVTRRGVCWAPRGLAYEAAGDLVHVACAGGELVSLPAAGGAVSRTVTLESDLRDVVVAPGGKLMVSTFRRAEVLVVGADGKILYRLQPSLGTLPNIFGAPRRVSPSVAWRMVPLNETQGTVVMLHQTGVDDEVVPGSGGYGSGLRGCGAIVQAGVSVLGGGLPNPPVAHGIQTVSLAVDVAVSPDKTQVALAVPGNASSLMPTVVAGPIANATSADPGAVVAPPDGGVRAGADAGAFGGVDAGVGSCAFLGAPSAPPKGEVISVAYTQNNILLAQTRDPAVLWRGGTVIPLSSEPRADTGHLLFHANAGAGLACASCHPEGGEDGRVWSFACQGARRTQSIRGNISGTAPFHWDGAETTFSTLMDDVFVQRMSGPKLTVQQKDALAGWIDTIPALPVRSGLDATAVSRGQALFNDPKVACATCHAGALLTNNATVDVGTGRAMQVPSLRGVSWRAPYMHNGCAPTLAARFDNATCGGGDKHGGTSTLQPTDIADLTAYLQSL
jgi:hypothetical protein